LLQLRFRLPRINSITN